MRKIVFCLFLGVLICGCAERKEETLLDNFDKKEHTILVEVFPELKKMLQAPACFYCLNQYFIFSEPKMDSLVFAYNKQTGNSRYYFPKGQGENEALKIASIGMGRDSLSCSLYDVGLQSLYMLKLDSSFSASVQKDTLLKRIGGMINSAAYDGKLSFYEKINSDTRFTLITPYDSLCFGNELKVRNLSSDVSTKVLQGPCSLSASKKRLFWFSSFGDVFEIYDYSKIDNIKNVCSLVLSVPNAGANGALSPEDRFGVTYAASDENFIYALYVGKTLKESLADRSKALFSNKVLVFDWDGNPCKILNLDRDICSISYSKMDKKLYGLGLDDDLNYTLYEVKVR